MKCRNLRRADRLFALIQALRGGRLRTAEALAISLEVSARTIYRDIADLQAAQVPIDGERGVGYILRDDYFLPPLRLSRLELEALGWGVSFVMAHGDQALSDAAQELQIKLKSAGQFGTSPLPLIFAEKAYKIEREMIKTLRETIAQHRKLLIQYADAAGVVTERTARPLSLEHWGRVWTLTTWCELRSDFRVFRVDRIESVQASDERFVDEPGKTILDFITMMREQP